MGSVDGPLVARQRSVVVENMVTPVILGADFWSRVPPLTLDFNSSQLLIRQIGLSVPLHTSSSVASSEDTIGAAQQTYPIALSEDVEIGDSR